MWTRRNDSGMIRADGQQRDFRRKFSADFLEAVEIRAVAGVINFPALMLQHKSAVAAMTGRAACARPNVCSA